jgi:hypothetical protein
VKLTPKVLPLTAAEVPKADLEVEPDHSNLNKCRSALHIAELKRRIERLVQKHRGSLKASGMLNMSQSLSRASQLKIKEIRQEYDREKTELKN